MKAGCAWSAARAIAHFASIPYDGTKSVDWEVMRTSNLVEGRTKLVARALTKGASHILWLDGDMKIPEDTIARLVNHNLAVVGVNYPTKELHSRPTAYRDDEDYVGPVWTKPDSKGLEQVSHMGFGCMLVDMRVMVEMELPYFQMVSVPPDHLLSISEDVYFCRKVQEMGVAIFIDHDASQNVAHIGDWEYTNPDAVASQRAHLELYAKLDDSPVKSRVT